MNDSAKGGATPVRELRIKLPKDLSGKKLSHVRQKATEAVVVELWQTGDMSTREAATELGLDYQDYLDLLGKRGIPVTGVSDPATLAELEREARTRLSPQ